MGSFRDMETFRTGAEEYFARRMEQVGYRAAYLAAKRRIEHLDGLIRTFDRRRDELGWSKAELARRAGLKGETVRKLFASDRPNPSRHTLALLAAALDLPYEPDEPH